MQIKSLTILLALNNYNADVVLVRHIEGSCKNNSVQASCSVINISPDNYTVFNNIGDSGKSGCFLAADPVGQGIPDSGIVENHIPDNIASNYSLMSGFEPGGNLFRQRNI
ncbi:MAG: hypothetical protein A4E69_00311 [Syntrophus sp. PtaB.Bin138]|nr:MAG: hypothetical protein A4E69_00311 [Syntrophus sp. PtaB.Bin138]